MPAIFRHLGSSIELSQSNKDQALRALRELGVTKGPTSAGDLPGEARTSQSSWGTPPIQLFHGVGL